jgi:uncharacterized protein YyaL (SSP411 family)
VLRLFARTAIRHPQGFAHLLRALDLWLEPTREVALVAPVTTDENRGDDSPVGPQPPADAAAAALADLAAVVRADFRPRLVLAAGPEGATEPPLLRDRTAADGSPTAYVCENLTCRLPTTSPEALRAELQRG